MAVTLPTVWSYGQYSSDNYGVHAVAVDVGPIRVYYSYRTPKAGALLEFRMGDKLKQKAEGGEECQA